LTPLRLRNILFYHTLRSRRVPDIRIFLLHRLLIAWLFLIDLMIHILSCKWITIVLGWRIILSVIIILVIHVMKKWGLPSKSFKSWNNRVLIRLNVNSLVRSNNFNWYMIISYFLWLTYWKLSIKWAILNRETYRSIFMRRGSNTAMRMRVSVRRRRFILFKCSSNWWSLRMRLLNFLFWSLILSSYCTFTLLDLLIKRLIEVLI
jgi:hypothetical protein